MNEMDKNPIYERFFGLNRKPFELVPNPDFLYLGGAHKKALTYLNYALQEKAGFIMLTGEVGSGKTTLIKDFISRLDRQTPVAKVFNTKVNFEQLIAMINDDFGLGGEGQDKVVLLRNLNEFLLDEHGRGHTPILVMDEAQNFSPSVLEEVRMLSNLETRDAKLLQILLVGQPELASMLSLPELRQLRQRISIVCHLYPLTKWECEDYIGHRLAVAGNRKAVTFSPEALDNIYAYSGGIPRLVNILCNFLLLTAFAEETRTISGEMVNDVTDELRGDARDVRIDDSAAGKRVFLHALEETPSGGQTPAPAQINAPFDVEKKIWLQLKDMSSRVTALEKGQARIKTYDLDSMGQRLELLEKWRTGVADANKRSSAPSGGDGNAGPTGAAAALQDNHKNARTKTGLFKRFVRAR